jgi:phosphoribosylformylglycinamidine synthase
MVEKIIHYYRKTETSHSLLPSCQEQLKALGLGNDAGLIRVIETESCFNVQLLSEVSTIQKERLEWLLAETFEKDLLRVEESFLTHGEDGGAVWQVEFGPRMTFTSAFSSNACSICKACDIPVERLELSKRYRFVLNGYDGTLSDDAITALKSMLHDRMTEEEYRTPLTTFESGAQAKPVITVPIMEDGRSALEKINAERGLGFDDFDLDYYTNLFKVCLEKNQDNYMFCPGCDTTILHMSTNVDPTFIASTPYFNPSCERKNWGETRRTSNVLIWVSQTRNILATGSSVGR